MSGGGTVRDVGLLFDDGRHDFFTEFCRGFLLLEFGEVDVVEWRRGWTFCEF